MSVSLRGKSSGLHNDAVSVGGEGEKRELHTGSTVFTQKMEIMLLFIYSILSFDFLVASGMKGNYL